MEIKDKLIEELVQKKQKTESVLNETIHLKLNHLYKSFIKYFIFNFIFL